MSENKTAKQIIEDFKSNAMSIDPGILKTIQFNAAKAQMELHSIHARAIACHCECLGMNAENCMDAIEGNRPTYPDESFQELMQKWGLIDNTGKPLI